MTNLNAHLNTSSHQIPICLTPSSNALDLVSSHGLGNRSKHSMQQILNHLLAALVAGLLDLLDARLGFGVGFVLGRLVALCVLCDC